MKKCAPEKKANTEKIKRTPANAHTKHMHMKNIMTTKKTNKKEKEREQEQERKRKRKKSEILFGAGNEIKHLSKKFQFDRRI